LRLSRGRGAVEDGNPVEGVGGHHEEDLGCGGQALDLLTVLQRNNLANRKWGRVGKDSIFDRGDTEVLEKVQEKAVKFGLD
jgi:hypothetical protein